MHHVPQRPGEPIYLPRRFDLGYVSEAGTRLDNRDMNETWCYYTSLYIVGKFRVQCGTVRSPGRRFGREVQREVQKGNDDRCAVGASALDIRD